MIDAQCVMCGTALEIEDPAHLLFDGHEAMYNSLVKIARTNLTCESCKAYADLLAERAVVLKVIGDQIWAERTSRTPRPAALQMLKDEVVRVVEAMRQSAVEYFGSPNAGQAAGRLIEHILNNPASTPSHVDAFSKATRTSRAARVIPQ